MEESDKLYYNDIDGLFYTSGGKVATREQVKEYHLRLFNIVENMFGLK